MDEFPLIAVEAARSRTSPMIWDFGSRFPLSDSVFKIAKPGLADSVKCEVFRGIVQKTRA